MSAPKPPPRIPEIFREDNLTSECRDLLSTLPTSPNGSFIGTNLYEYEGFWVVPKVVQGVVRCQKIFEAHDTDTILVSNPKLGTTWLKAMAFSLVNRSKYLNQDQDQHPLLTTNPHDLVPFLETELYVGKDLPDLSTFTSPRLFATHMPVGSLPRSVKDSSCKIVYLCRNPKDMFVSMWHYSNKVRTSCEFGTNKLEDFFDRFCSGKIAYGPFWDHIMGYWNESLKDPQKVLFLKYEDIHENPTAQLRRLAEFLKCPFSSEEEANGLVEEITKLCSFDHLRNLEVNKSGKLSTGQEKKIYFRNGVVGNWNKVLTPKMAERLDHITEQKMYNLGFKF